MSRIRSKNTKPEILVRKYLFARGYRFRIHVKTLPGHPDIVLRKYRTVIFVNGCFWHGHEGCKYYVLPKSNVEFWKNKIQRNQIRDKEERIRLKEMGWHVILLWECQLKPKERELTLKGLEYTLSKIYLDDRKATQIHYIRPTEAEQPSYAVAEEEVHYGKSKPDTTDS